MRWCPVSAGARCLGFCCLLGRVGGRACCALLCHSSVWSASSGFMGFGRSTLSSLGQLVSLSSPLAAVLECSALVAAWSTCTGGALALAGCCCVCGWVCACGGASVSPVVVVACAPARPWALLLLLVACSCGWVPLGAGGRCCLCAPLLLGTSAAACCLFLLASLGGCPAAACPAAACAAGVW